MAKNTKDRFTSGAVAQLVERQRETLRVIGATPICPTIISWR